MFRHSTIIIILSLLIIAGTVGYTLIEGWSIHDSLYMTIITITTTGFGEIHKLSEQGRNLTMVLLIVGMGVVAYSISAIMNDLLTINFDSRRRRKMDKEIALMKNHTIICGHGRMGKIVADEISKSHNNFIVIEKDPIKLKLLEQMNCKYLEGDATHDDVLLKAGVDRANILVSMIDNDADALYLALAARSFNADLQIIVRAADENARSKILRAGANRVVLPVLMSGLRVAQSILNPAVEDYLDLSSINEGDKVGNQLYQLADINVLAHSKLIGKKLDLCHFQKQGLVIVGIKKNNHEFIFSPDDTYDIEKGDTILGLGTKESFNKFYSLN